MNSLQSKVEEIIASSPTLEASSNTIMIVAHLIIDYIKGNYVIEPKQVWYGKDWDAEIKYHRQRLAIAYSCKNKEKACSTITKEVGISTSSKPQSMGIQQDMFLP